MPQSGEKDQFYCTFYHITLNVCEAHRLSQSFKKNWGGYSYKTKLMHGWFECIFLLFYGEDYV